MCSVAPLASMNAPSARREHLTQQLTGGPARSHHREKLALCQELLYTEQINPVPGATRMDLPMVLVPHPHVRVDKNVLGGSPHVVGSRVPVRRLWSFYRKGVGI